MGIPFPGPGIHFGYPEQDYFKVEACSASVSKALLRSPWEGWSASWMNAMRPEKKSEALKLGKCMHVALLEGERAFGQRYDIEPSKDDYPGLLSTNVTMGEYLEANGLKKSGSNDALVERIREFDAVIPLWHEITTGFERSLGNRLAIKREKWLEVQRARFVINHLPSLRELFGVPGAAEVTIFFYGHGGVPMKCRLDRLQIGATIDLKSYSNRMGKEIFFATIGALCSYRYDIQAVIYREAVAEMKRLYAEQGMGIFHGELPDDLSLAWLDKVLTHPENRFYFTFLQTGDTPNVSTIEFEEFEEKEIYDLSGGVDRTVRSANTYYSNAVLGYHRAAEIYADCMAHYGPDRPWIVDHGIRRLKDCNLPLWMLQEGAPEPLDLQSEDEEGDPQDGEPDRKAA